MSCAEGKPSARLSLWETICQFGTLFFTRRGEILSPKWLRCGRVCPRMMPVKWLLDPPTSSSPVADLTSNIVGSFKPCKISGSMWSTSLNLPDAVPTLSNCCEWNCANLALQKNLEQRLPRLDIITWYPPCRTCKPVCHHCANPNKAILDLKAQKEYYCRLSISWSRGS